MTKDRSLKNIIVDKNFQLRFMGYFFSLFLLTTASIYAAIFLFFWNFKKKALNVGIPDDHVFFKYLANQKHDMDLMFIGLLAFNLILLLGLGFWISHRIAGPIRKLRLHLETLTAASPDIKLREKDFFKELATGINHLRNKIEK